MKSGSSSYPEQPLRAAVDSRLRDKPLDWWGSLRKGFGARTGYEINGGTGWRCDVCLHAASKSSELAHMNDRLSTSAVLLNQYCDFFFSSPLVLSVRRDSEHDIHSCCAFWGGAVLRPSWNIILAGCAWFPCGCVQIYRHLYMLCLVGAIWLSFFF